MGDLFYLRTRKEAIDSGCWYLYVKCESGDMFAMMGTTHSLVNETESRRVLGQWLRSLNVTQWIGEEDFEYSSGSCQNWDVKKIIKIGLFVLVVAGVYNSS